jgi:hypothetical protein
MHNIEMHEMTEAFFPCWKAAGIHLSKQVDGGIQSWLRAHPYPPFLEHLSFRLGNQLFFVRIEDVDGKAQGPGTIRGLAAAAKDGNGHACILPMKKKLFGGSWVADMPGWGLLNAETRKPMNPVSLVTEEKIEMTPWEVHDMAVQMVRDYLQKEGFELMSWQGNPEVDPSIWFVGKTRRTRVGRRAVGQVPGQQRQPPDQLGCHCRWLRKAEYHWALRVGRCCKREPALRVQ